jgi:hypothetical protein
VDHCTAHPNPPAIPTGVHHILLCFQSDGSVSFFPSTDDPAELAQRLALLVRLFVEEPAWLRCVAADHAHPAADPHHEH